MKHFFSILLLTLLALQLSSQSVSGRVIDQDNQPLIAALITNQANSGHAHTDINGKFTIEGVSVGDTLNVSYLGYKSSSINVDNIDNSLEIRLDESPIAMDEIIISPGINALKVFSDIDIKLTPVNSSQEILRQVPGLMIGQHAGGGKAEQIFLRGFDLDHGTDIRLNVDGMPVNMVSHAHGQGYADLHFIIPETIKNLNFGKGSYDAEQGNFATAGYVDFRTQDRISENMLKLEGGQFNTQRVMTMVSLGNNEKKGGYLAAEYQKSDGPFESSQNFSRLNLSSRYDFEVSDNQRVALIGSYFTSTWDASGQVPQRAIDDGSITRFGAIDDTEGGTTSRANISLKHLFDLGANSYIENQVFYNYYDFTLFSNFTFFLNDPINGDQIKQQENRSIFGVNSTYRTIKELGNTTIDLKAGYQLRSDNSNNNRLARTLNRTEILSNISFGDIREDNQGVFADATIDLGNWILNGGVRYDQFWFNYVDRMSTTYSTRSETKGIFSPKLSLLYNQSNNLQYYIKTGKGFHSNDTRVVVDQLGQSILPSVYSGDIGLIAKPWKNVILNVAYWVLFSEQEFVYVGDEGIVEPSGRSLRNGFDLSTRFQFANNFFANVDVNYTIATAIDEAEGEDRIPLAPLFTINGGLDYKHDSGFQSSINVRHVGDRPANEDNSIVAIGYTVVDAAAGYQYKKVNFGIQAQNLLNTEWNETQFATESRLAGESVPVEEIHFTPGTPFNLRGIVTFTF